MTQRLLWFVLLSVACVGCGSRTTSPGGIASQPAQTTTVQAEDQPQVVNAGAAIAEDFGNREHLFILGGFKVKPPGKDSVTIEFNISSDRDGSLFIHAHRASNDIFDVYVDSKRHLTLHMIYENEYVVSGPLQELALSKEQQGLLPLLIGSIDFLIDEIRYGPVAPHAPWTTIDNQPQQLVLHQHSRKIVLNLDAAGQPHSKTFFHKPADADWQPLLTLQYQRIKTYSSRLKRAEIIRIIIPDNDTYLRLSLRTLDAPASRDPLSLTPAQDLPRMTLSEWIQSLRKEDHEQTATNQSAE